MKKRIVDPIYDKKKVLMRTCEDLDMSDEDEDTKVYLVARNGERTSCL